MAIHGRALDVESCPCGTAHHMVQEHSSLRNFFLAISESALRRRLDAASL